MILRLFTIFLFIVKISAESCVKDIHSTYHNYTFHQLHTTYPIVTFAKNIVHAEDVNYILNMRKKYKFVRSGLMNSKPTEARTSSTIFLPKNKDPILDCIGKRISTAIHQPYNHMESFQMTKYDQGQLYKPHWDWFRDKTHDTQRTHTVFIYLKTAKCGGTTVFPYLDINITASPGSGLIWSNLDYMGDGESLVKHGGSSVTCNDTKIGLNVWFQNTCWPRKSNCSIQPFKKSNYDDRIRQNAEDIKDIKKQLKNTHLEL